jgi:hypothetical protein
MGLLALVLAGSAAQLSRAQDSSFVSAQPFDYEVPYSEWKDCGLRKGDVNAFVVHRLDRETPRSKTATIQVRYGPNFPSVARSAYERAVDIWERHIDSDIEIRIAAGGIEDPEDGVLGGTIPTQFWILEDEEGPQVIAGDALADVLLGQDVAPDSTDMLTDFNFERNDWHFGEGPAPEGTIDFTTVALHEIAHGLHYLSLCRKTPGGGQCRFGGGGGAVVPDAFSQQLLERRLNGELRSLTDEDAYSSSQSLGQALTSDRLVFAGTKAEEGARRSTGPVPPKIYAPFSFQEGSSLSHVDEDTYPFEGTNALMTPFVAPAETNRQPGPIVCGQLSDIGWPLSFNCEQHFQDVFDVRFVEEAAPETESVTLTWDQREQANIKEFIIEQRYFDGGYRVAKKGIDAPPVTLDSLGLGRFSFRVRWVRSDGTEGVSVRSLEKTVPLEDLTAEVAGRDEEGRGTVELTWDVPPGTPSTFTFHVERARGDEAQFQQVGASAEQQFSAQRQPPGRYSYRVVSRDQEGNALVSTEAPLQISFDGPVYANGPFPNPVRNQATLILTARQFQDTAVEVYNAIGERVYRRRRVLGQQEPTRFRFDTQEWASGVYFVRVRGRSFSMTRKMVVVH